MGFAHIPTEIRQVSKDYRGVDVGKTTTQGHTPQDLISSGHVVSSEPTGIIELSEARSQDDRHVESTSPTQKPSKSIGWKPDEELCGSWGTNYFEHNHSFHRNQALPSPYDMRENSIGVALGFGKAFARIASVGLKSPMDFSISLARGFQHTQKMLGDKTVRRPERVTDLKSGFAAAGRTLGFGFLDALSGIIVQPVNGARDGGPVGLVKGIGRGLSGIVLKPGAAMTGFPAYALKGMYKELKNYISLDFSRYIVAARKAEGEEELRNSTEETRSSITQWWQELDLNVNRKQK